MLAQCRRRWTNIKLSWGQCLGTADMSRKNGLINEIIAEYTRLFD